MSDETQAQATETAQPAQGVTATATQETTTQAPATPAVTVEELQAQIARMEKALKDANKGDADKRKRLAELEKLEQERQQATLSETEKLKAQIAERDKKLADEQAAREKAQADAQQTRIKSAIMAQASALGFHDAEDAYNLIDLAAVTVAADSDKVTGIKEALAALAKSKPYMLKASSPRPPQVSPTNPGGDASGGMTDDQLRVMIFGTTNRRGFTRQEAEKHGGGVVWNKAKE